MYSCVQHFIYDYKVLSEKAKYEDADQPSARRRWLNQSTAYNPQHLSHITSNVVQHVTSFQPIRSEVHSVIT